MRYRINQIKLDIEDLRDGDAIARAVRKSLGRRELDIKDIEIVKESVDARRKPDIKLVYTVDFSSGEVLDLGRPAKRTYEIPKIAQDEADAAVAEHGRPVVVGFGPAGMFAALILAEAGFRPVVLERGQDAEKRAETVRRFWEGGPVDPESNVQFGEGGAGTFSDGKLTTGIKDIRISKVVSELIEAGADSSISYVNKPHIGTDRLRGIVGRIRRKILSLGGDVMLCTKMTGIVTESGREGRRLAGIYTAGTCERTGEESKLSSHNMILASGHSARDVFSIMEDEGVYMEQKPFSIGVRIEHPQEMIDIAQYGSREAADILGPADYKLNCRCADGRGVYTFCMCPGGEVIDSSSGSEEAVTNGMSESSRDSGYANSGLLVDVRVSDFASEDVLAGAEFQRRYEKLAYINGGGGLVKTDLGSFMRTADDPVRASIPSFAADDIKEAMPVLGRRLRGFDSEEARLTGVESRSSSPVRIVRDESGQCSIPGIFPAGEGAGYAGGIMSAAADGIRQAENVIKAML